MSKFDNATTGTDGSAGAKSQEQKEEQIKTYTDEEVQKLIQAEADRRVNQALKNEKEKMKIEIEREKKEAERLANLSAEERLKEELSIKEQELQKLRNDISRKELLETTIQILNQRDLPTSMAKLLMGQNAEETLNNINEYEKAWLKDREKVVNNAFKGKSPSGMIPVPNGKTEEEIEEEKIRKAFQSNYVKINYK